jgi:PIN domain nuclease of toxin-antitoxin system
MKYLIDTHIFLWSLFSPQKIFKDPFDRMIIWQAIREKMVLTVRCQPTRNMVLISCPSPSHKPYTPHEIKSASAWRGEAYA